LVYNCHIVKKRKLTNARGTEEFNGLKCEIIYMNYIELFIVKYKLCYDNNTAI